MRNIVKGNGKVHGTLDTFDTLCGRVVAGFTVTDREVTCKVCQREDAKRVTLPAPVIGRNDALDLARTCPDGAMRHRMVTGARQHRRRAMKALARSL